MSSNKESIEPLYWLVELKDGLTVIAKDWLAPDETYCFYPNTKQKSKIDKALKERSLPKSKWKVYDIMRVFGKYGTLSEATIKIARAEVSSDLNAEVLSDASTGVATASGKADGNENLAREQPSISKTSRTNPPRQTASRSYTVTQPDWSSSSLSSMSDNDDDILPSPPRSPPGSERNGKRINFPREESSALRAKVRGLGKVDLTAGKREPSDPEKKKQSTVTAKPRDPPRVNPRPDNNKLRDPPRLQQHAGVLKPATEGNAKRYCTHDYHCLSDDRLWALEDDIHKIKLDVRRIAQQLRELPDSMAVPSNGIKDISELTSFDDIFPLKNENDVKELENLLKTDVKKAEYLEKFFKTIGGQHLNEAVRNALVRTFTNEVATNYSWEGRRGKNKLEGMKIITILYKALFATCKEINESKFKERARDWFRQAGGRIKSHEKRQQNAVGAGATGANENDADGEVGGENVADKEVAGGNLADKSVVDRNDNDEIRA